MKTGLFTSLILNRIRQFGSASLPPLFAVLSVFFIEIARFTVHGTEMELYEIAGYGNLFLVAAVIYTLLFTFASGISRIISSSLKRVDTLWQAVGPGFIIFLFLIEPIIQAGRSMTFAVSAQTLTTLILPVYILGFGILLFLILFLLKSFPGHNMAFLLTGILISRLLLHPFFQFTDPLFFTGVHAAFSVLSWLIYLLFLYRQRLRLIFGYDRFEVSPVSLILQAAGAFFLSFGIIILWKPYSGMDLHLLSSIQKFHTAVLIYLTVSFAGLMQLFLYIIFIFLKNNFKGADSLFIPASAAALIIFLFGTGSAAALLSGISEVNTGLPVRSPLLREGVLRIAEQNDSDQDGNSSWPGNDPDDSDPCRHESLYFLRKSLHTGNDSCTSEKIQNSISFRNSSASEITLITINSQSREFSFSDESLKKIRSRILLAGTTQPAALNGLIRFSDSRFLFSDSTGVTFFSLLAASRYRTICLFQPESDYVRIHLTGQPSELRPGRNGDFLLDQGCQILYNTKAEMSSESDHQLKQTGFADFSAAKASVYRKKKTAVWIHSDEMPESDIIKLIKSGIRHGPVILVMMNLPDPVADLTLFVPRENSVEWHPTGNSDILTSLIPVLEGSLRAEIESTALIDGAFTGIQITDNPAKKLPVITYRLKNGFLEFRNSLTGEVHQRRISAVPPPR